MIEIPISRIISYISQHKQVSQDVIRQKISQKLVEFAGLLSEEGAAHIVANEMGVDLYKMTQTPLKIAEIVSQLRDATVIGKVITIYEKRLFETERGSGSVQSVLIGDETGIMRVTFWHDQIEKIQFGVGDVLQFSHVTSRQNQGRFELGVTKDTEIEKLDIDITLHTSRSQNTVQYRKKKISAIVPNEQVTLFGVIVGVNPPYYYMVDRETQKKAIGEFDQLKHEYTPIASIILDDGTGNIRISAFRAEAGLLYGVPLSKVLELKDATESFEAIRQACLGNHIRVSGKVSFNESYNRHEMIAQVVEPHPTPDEDITEYYS
jgi:replication factor A1